MKSLGAAVIVAALLAGCGGHREQAAPKPKLPRTLAHQLAARSDDVAHKLDAGDGCGALATARALQREAIAAVNARRVPGPFQEPLTSAATRLTVEIRCTPPPPAAQKPPGKKEKHEKHGEHGKGKHGGEGD